MVAMVLGVSHADAKGKRKKKKKKAPALKVSAENAKALSQLKGPFKFGMSKNRVLKILAKQIREKYAEKIKETDDVYQQDKLRRRQKKEISRIKKSFVAFKGKKTGWDVSIIDDEFAHRTDESMMVYWENVGGKDQRRFFFFYDGRLWKMFIALSDKMLKPSQREFSYFQTIMEKRYGMGKVHNEVKRGVEVPTHISWSTSKFRVRAIDKLQFYGNFCLSIADPGTEDTLRELRKSVAPVKKKNKIIEAVISKDDAEDTPDLNDNKGALDGIIGTD